MEQGRRRVEERGVRGVRRVEKEERKREKEWKSGRCERKVSMPRGWRKEPLLVFTNMTVVIKGRCESELILISIVITLTSIIIILVCLLFIRIYHSLILLLSNKKQVVIMG